jgi:hypothetical protein
MTRRQALGMAAGAALAAGFAARRVPVAGADALDPAVARAATLAGILAALSVGPAAGRPAGALAAYRDEFWAYHAAADPPFRTWADGALDRVAAAGDLAAMTPEAAYATLQAWAADPARQGVAADALELASLTFVEDELRQPGYALVVA